LAGDLLGFLFARGVEHAGVAAHRHGDVVVGTAARAVGAADAKVVDVDLAVLLAMDGAGRTADHALGVGAVITARRDEDVLMASLFEAVHAAADLFSAARQPRGAVSIVAAGGAI